MRLALELPMHSERMSRNRLMVCLLCHQLGFAHGKMVEANLEYSGSHTAETVLI